MAVVDGDDGVSSLLVVGAAVAVECGRPAVADFKFI